MFDSSTACLIRNGHHAVRSSLAPGNTATSTGCTTRTSLQRRKRWMGGGKYRTVMVPRPQGMFGKTTSGSPA